MFRYTVETRQGDFDFLAEIIQATLLMAIIQRYSKNSVDREWHLRDDIRMSGGEAARWSSGQIGVGARAYHYRTRANRALLWLPPTLCVVWCFLSRAAWQGLIPGSQATGPLCAANGIVAGRGERLRFGSGIIGYDELKTRSPAARRSTAGESGGATLPGFHQMTADAVGESQNRQHGVEAAVGDVQRAVGDIQIVVTMDAAPGIGDRGLRIMPHAAGAGLMLPAAEELAGRMAMNPLGAAGTQPFFTPRPHEVVCTHGFAMGRAGQTGDGQAPLVADVGIYRDAGVRTGDFMDRPHCQQHPCIVMAHPFFMSQTPARDVAWDTPF